MTQILRSHKLETFDKKLRHYQKPVFYKVLDRIISRKNPRLRTPLIAFCTGSGKTILAQSIVSAYTKLRVRSRVLILTHNQKIIRQNFTSNYLFDGFEIQKATDIAESRDHRVVVAIPSTIYKNLESIGKFDLVVIDEAHEYYRKKMVRNILEALSNPRKLLLTASHGQFPNERYEKFFYSVLEGYQEGYLANCEIKVITQPWKISKTDYRDDELNNRFRLSRSTVHGTARTIYRLIGSKNGRMPKTLIACHNISMADDIKTWLIKNGVKGVGVSYSDSGYGENVDPSSSMIERFKSSPKERVLIVVRRGVLGFNTESIQVVIDLTASRNIDKTMQLMGRGLRPFGNRKKLFVKIMPKYLEEYSYYMMAAVVGLFHPRNYEAWTGDKNSLPIIYRSSDSSEEKHTWSLSKQPKIESVVLDFEEYLQAFEELETGNSSKYLKTTIEKVSKFNLNIEQTKEELIRIAESGRPKPNTSSAKGNQLLGAFNRYTKPKHSSYDPEFDRYIRSIRPDWYMSSDQVMKERLIAMMKNGEPKPSTTSRNKELKKMATALHRYINPNLPDYDEKFKEVVDQYSWFKNNHEEKKQEIILHAINGKSKPRQKSKARYERELYRHLFRFTNRSSKCFDPDFAENIRNIAPLWYLGDHALWERLIFDWIRDVGYKPKKSTKNEFEKRLLKKVLSYARESSPYYRPKIKKALENAPNFPLDEIPTPLIPTSKKKAAIIAWAKRGKPKPRYYSENPHEKWLAIGLASYCNPNSEQFDQLLTDELKALAPAWWTSKAEKMKKRLLEMASKGERRPHNGASRSAEERKMADALHRYTHPQRGSYDPFFSKRIRKLRPDWFDRSLAKRNELLRMARTGEKKPDVKSSNQSERKLAQCLAWYMLNFPEFREEMLDVAPHWFNYKLMPNKGAS